MKSKKILVIGSSNTDMTVKTDKLPAPGETVLGGVFTMGNGGKGANQAVAAKRLGGDVTFVCKVGKDLFGENSSESYSREGLDISHILYSEKPSGVALINVDANAENSISVASGANMDFSVEDIRKIEDVIREAGIMLLQLEIPVETVLEAARIASESGTFVILNPAPACTLPSEIYRYVSLVIPNETEVSQMSGVQVTDCATAEEAAGRLRLQGAGNVIITLGSKGSLICGNVALAEGKDLVQAVRFATVASSIAVTRSGAQESVPKRDEVDDALSAWK